MSNTIDDKELDDYLSGDTQYSRRYRAIAADTVPSELDSLVLANATADTVVAIGTAPSRDSRARRSKSLGFWVRVSAPVALAASFVLVFSIMMESRVRHDSVPLGNIETQSLPETPDVASYAKPAADSLPQTAAIQAPAAMEAKAPSEQDKLEKAPPAKRSASNAIAQSSDMSKIIVSGQLAQSHAEEAALPVDTPAREEVARSNTPASSLPVVAPVIVAAAPASTSSDSAVAKEKPAPSTTESRDNALRSSGTTGLEEVVVTAQMRRDSSAGAGPRNSVPSSSFSEREPSAAEIAQERRESNPAAWLAYIRELRVSSKTRAADREWQRFVKAFPNYVVDAADAARPKK